MGAPRAIPTHILDVTPAAAFFDISKWWRRNSTPQSSAKDVTGPQQVNAYKAIAQLYLLVSINFKSDFISILWSVISSFFSS